MEKDGDRRLIRVDEILDDVESAAAYKRLISKWRFFQHYAERASRTIPVFRLLPRDRPVPKP
jgi:3'-phosphoadenosine 5'-phosphosulfate sulfotransferase